MSNGEWVARFEAMFAEYVGARYAIALCNGTATLHTALVALGVKPGDRVAVPPLTMASTTIAVLHAGAVPVFCDVHPDTWLMGDQSLYDLYGIAVSLYGLHSLYMGPRFVDDAAQTLRPHHGAAFTSYSFQASKILPLGEGGMLCTNNEELATRAREFSSLGYRMDARQPRIRPEVLKSSTHQRHHSLGWNYRMNDLTAQAGCMALAYPAGLFSGTPQPMDRYVKTRQEAAILYRHVIAGCEWLTPQHVPEGWKHDYWTYAVATDTPERCLWLLDAMERHGGERPYPAWLLTYQEPAFRYLAPSPQSTERWTGLCPVAESLQPRLVQFQTNSIRSAERNAAALLRCIEEAG